MTSEIGGSNPLGLHKTSKALAEVRTAPIQIVEDSLPEGKSVVSRAEDLQNGADLPRLERLLSGFIRSRFTFSVVLPTYIGPLTSHASVELSCRAEPRDSTE